LPQVSYTNVTVLPSKYVMVTNLPRLSYVKVMVLFLALLKSVFIEGRLAVTLELSSRSYLEEGFWEFSAEGLLRKMVVRKKSVMLEMLG